MEQNRLVLNDGTTIDDGFASKSSANQLMIRVPGKDIAAAAVMFGDSQKTEIVVCYYGIYKYAYTGYTNMYSVMYFEEGNYVEIWLNAPEGTHAISTRELTVPAEYVPSEAAKEGSNA